MKFTGEWLKFYNNCLETLRAREGFNEVLYLPFVERYVFATMQGARLAEEIQKEPLTIQHTNNKSKTNEATSPKVRVFALLNQEANSLAKHLGLDPLTAVSQRRKIRPFNLEPDEVFDLRTPMKVDRTAT